MYQRILIPTDGSEPSQRGIAAAVKLASVVGAQVIGLTVTPDYHTWTLDPTPLMKRSLPQRVTSSAT